MAADPTANPRRIRGRLVRTARSHVGWPAFRHLPLRWVEELQQLRGAFTAATLTDAPMFAIRMADPASIERSVLRSAPRIPQWGQVVGGDWERESEPFGNRAVPRGLEQRFTEGRPWRETALFDAFREQLARFGNAWGYTAVDRFAERCREVDQLYEDIRESGYRTQTELAGRGYETTSRLDEINVDIGRDGSLYWRCCGQHRLAIARVLDLERVPVIVQRRHPEWQAIRDRLRRNPDAELPERIRDHPDLTMLLAEADES